MATRLVCSEVYLFVCGQLGVVLADRDCVVFVLANRDLKQHDAVMERRRSVTNFYSDRISGQCSMNLFEETFCY